MNSDKGEMGNIFLANNFKECCVTNIEKAAAAAAELILSARIHTNGYSSYSMQL